MLGEDGRDAVAREVAAGLAISDVARCHGLQPSALRNMLASDDDLRARVDSYKDVLNLGAQQLMAKTWLAANDAIDAIITVARNPVDKQHFEANKYLVDKVWPTKTVSEQSVTHHLDGNIALQIKDGLDALRTVRQASPYNPNADPHLQNGKDVVYGVDLDPPTPELEPQPEDPFE